MIIWGHFPGFLNTLGVPLNETVHKMKKTSPGQQFKEVNGRMPEIFTLCASTPQIPRWLLTDCLTTLVIHSLLHYKTGRDGASHHHFSCPFQFIAGVPPTQAPSWQHLLPEDFGKNLGNLSRAPDSSLEKTHTKWATWSPAHRWLPPLLLRTRVTDRPNCNFWSFAVATSCIS